MRIVGCYGYQRKCLSSVPSSQQMLIVNLLNLKTKHKQGLIPKSREAMIASVYLQVKVMSLKTCYVARRTDCHSPERASIIGDKSCSVHSGQETESPIQIDNDNAVYTQWSFIALKQSEVVAFSGKLVGLEIIVLSEEAYMHENTRRNPIVMLGVAIGEVLMLL